MLTFSITSEKCESATTAGKFISLERGSFV